jgi:uncharacterized membrane protein
MKINFNYKSVTAWATLCTSIITGIIGILTAAGVVVPPDFQSNATGLVTAILGILGALGILTTATDDPNKKG